MLGPILAFTTLIAWSLSDLVAKHALSKQPLWFINFWGQLLGGIGILILGIFLGEIQGVPLGSLAWIAFFSALNLFGMFFFYKTIQHKGVALGLSLVYSWSIPSIFLGLLFLNQVPSPLQWVGVIAVIIGVFLISVDRHEQVWIDKGTVTALISMFTWGVFYFLIAEPSELYGEWLLGSGLKIGSAFLSLPFLLREKSQFISKTNPVFWTVGLLGLLDAVGLVALSTGLQFSSVAVMTGITSTTPAIVAIFGILLFKEEVNRQQRIGIFTTVLGLLTLVL